MSAVRKLARLVVPRSLRDVIRSRLDTQFRDRRYLEHDVQMGRVVFSHAGPVVQAGPFKGMYYPSPETAFTLGPKLLGTYEMELHSVIERCIAADFRHVVNIGSGEGYYAVGLARRLPQAKVIAFDADPKKRQQLGELAAANGVADRIEVHGLASPDDLAAALDVPRPLLICDVEGAELELLDPVVAPPLQRATIIAEMHDILCKGLSRNIYSRFRPIHEISVIPARRRRRSDWPSSVPRHRRWSDCLAEGRRGPMTWSYLRPR